MLISRYGNGSTELVKEFENKQYLPIGEDYFGNLIARIKSVRKGGLS